MLERAPRHRAGADGHHDAGDRRLRGDAADPRDRALRGPADHRAHRQGHARRSREVHRGRLPTSSPSPWRAAGCSAHRARTVHQGRGSSDEPSRRRQSEVSILLVDDRPENLLALERRSWSRPDYNLVLARSGEEALQLVLRHEFALILLDVAMPRMDGFEVARVIKQRERYRLIPIIFVTASRAASSGPSRATAWARSTSCGSRSTPRWCARRSSVFVELFRQRQQIRKQAQLLRERRAPRERHGDHAAQARERAPLSHPRRRDPARGLDRGPDGAFEYLNRTLDRAHRAHRRRVGRPPTGCAAIHPDDQDGLRRRVDATRCNRSRASSSRRG